MRLDPCLLPDIGALRLRTKALAMLEAIVCPDWESRYYSVDSRWGEGEEMASMRNGQGDDWFILFGPFGVGIKGLAHESPLARDASLAGEAWRQVPATFASFLEEPAFGWEAMTYCYWRSHEAPSWSRFEPPRSDAARMDDGSSRQLSMLVEGAPAYAAFAAWYHERGLPLRAIEAMFRCEPLSTDLVRALNPDASMAGIAADAEEIGYPAGKPA